MESITSSTATTTTSKHQQQQSQQQQQHTTSNDDLDNDDDDLDENYDYPWCVRPSQRPNIFLKRPDLIQSMTTTTTSRNHKTNQPQAKREQAVVVGLIFIKNTKAASSTGAGVTLRIAEQVGKRLFANNGGDHHNIINGKGIMEDGNVHNNTTVKQQQQQHSLASISCVRNWTHAFANARGHAVRGENSRQSFLWTIVRYPPQRDISAFLFFEHARKGIPIDDNAIKDYLQAQKSGQFRYLHTTTIANDNQQPAWQEWYHQQQQQQKLSNTLRQLLHHYDFIAIAERMEESLAVLTFLLHCKPQDVIVLSSKTNGGYDDGKYKNKCHKIPKPNNLLSDEIKTFVRQSPAYRNDNLDFVLYAAANTSLDQSIRNIGQQRVARRVHTIRRLSQIAHESCQHKAVYPCSADGRLQRTAARQSCYIDDSGCGHDCVDQALLSSTS